MMAELDDIKEEMSFTSEDKKNLVPKVKVKKKKSKMKYIHEPEVNVMEEFEIKKMKQGMSYTCKEKTIILNVFKYFRNQYPDKCVTDIVRRTAKATGCSEKSVFQFRKEESSSEGFKEPSKTKVRKNININSRDIKYDNAVRTTIRNIIYDLQYKNIVPSLNTILKQICINKQMPKFSVMTLRRLMFDMGFSYQKSGNKFILVEKPDNRLLQPNQNDINNQMPQNKPSVPQQIQPMNHLQDMSHIPPSIPSHVPPPDQRTNSTIHKPMHMPLVPSAPLQNDHMLGPPHPDMLHSHPHNMIHKTMPMMMNPRRDMMHPAPAPVPPTIDMHRKPWMHGIIKQGQ